MPHQKNKTNKEQVPPSIEQEKTPAPKNGSFSWRKLALILSPGCIYFFGYCSQVYYMDGIGFSSPSIPFDVGSAYLHAFRSLLFTTDLAVADFKVTYFKQINDSWLTTLIISTIVPVVVILLRWGMIKNRENRSEDSIETKSNAESPSSKFTMKKVFILSGVGMFSVNFLNFLMLPLLVLMLVMPTIILIIPAALGSRMAADEMKNFSCEPLENQRYLPCATIEFRDKSQVTGRIYLRNGGIIYMRTTEAAMEIPESDVLKVFRKDLNVAKNSDPNRNSPQLQ